MAKNIKLLNVDSTMVYGQTLPADVLEAWTLTATFAQAAARAAVKKPRSRDAGSRGTQAEIAPDDIVSEAYFNTLTAQFTQLGWLITTSGLVKYGAPSKQVKPRQVVQDVLAQYIQPDDETILTEVLNTLQDSSEPDPQVADFLEFWWQNAEVGDDHFHFGIGPLRVVGGQPVVTLVYFSFTYNKQSEKPGWRRLFRATKVQVRARYLSMRLNMEVYSKNRAQLKDRLEEKSAEHVAMANLDL
jgi:hypothetical protein